MSEILTPLVYQIGLGGIGGFIAGLILKKLTKLFIIVVGIIVAILLYLGISDVININYGDLWTAIGNAIGVVGGAASWLVGLISILPFVGSFAAGFVLGFMIG
ncbi:MAG TPA: FUN14 domain-containing protein [Candidatus Bathyarchaeia archaeon]|nr:FUN14 domain-containing protein [Candidatus Bathyarchaeia archaeon]